MNGMGDYCLLKIWGGNYYRGLLKPKGSTVRGRQREILLN
jgi:hypothetical protein